ncbi:MAG: hypothetical protein JXN62_02375 [Bacteroidales bacterium]|nr:hypothetical protein [Bacteroidales bacterium]
MASTIPGYKYDIFISYRQKDNKGDRWVSEFVEALKNELESTFKEEISVYFDENPHDGLLETHDVGASLQDKLKCLVFIPVVSRTYCDPSSFAWEHEFKAFVEKASEDQFGLKVKLPNGNVAYRVLPIRIHDLDSEDIKLYESVLGGVLRGVEFIYKEPGVNKPLTPADDEKKNLNHTQYRIQINRTALAIKEIILGLKSEQFPEGKAKIHNKEVAEINKGEKKPEEQVRPGILGKGRWLSTILVAALLIIAALFLYPKIFKRDKFQDIRDPEGRISIAVMPFENLTGDTTLNWFQRGISSLIINGLGTSSELAVFDDQTMFEILGSNNQVYTAGFSPSVAREVARKAKAETYVSGSFQGRENTYWILLNLVNTETGNLLWTNKVEGNLRSSAYLEMADSLCNEIKNYLEIKALKDIADYDFRDAYPTSAEAYRYFIEGMNLVLNQNYESGIRSLKKAVEIDSAFTFASFYLAYAYNLGTSQSNEQAINWLNKAYHNKDRVPPKYQLWLELWNACFVSKNFKDISRFCDLLAESGINTRLLWFDLGATYASFLQNSEKAVKAFEKVMEINLERADNWEFVRFWDAFLESLHNSGNHEREKEIAEIGLSAIPNNSNWIYFRQAICALSRGDTLEADEVFQKYYAKHKELGTSEWVLELWTGQIYEEANLTDQAEIHYRKSFELFPESYARYINLAWFLILNDINIDEGMGLVDKALEISPNSITAIALKGIGFYKQGRYEEAVQLLGEAWDKYNEANPIIYSNLEKAKKALAAHNR